MYLYFTPFCFIFYTLTSMISNNSDYQECVERLEWTLKDYKSYWDSHNVEMTTESSKLLYLKDWHFFK